MIVVWRRRALEQLIRVYGCLREGESTGDRLECPVGYGPYVGYAFNRCRPIYRPPYVVRYKG